jgi:hypothetical protein
MTHSDARSTFLARFHDSLVDGSFRRLVLGKPRRGRSDEEGSTPTGPLKVVVEPVTLARGPRLRVLERHLRRDLTHTLETALAEERVAAHLGHDLHSAHLFTPHATVQLVYNQKGRPRLTRGPAASELTAAGGAAFQPPPHDREKSRLVVPAEAPWLAALDVAGTDGRIRPAMMAKFRQLNRFVEIVAQLLAESPLADAPHLRVIDMGAGKGYLTFGVWHYLARVLGRTAAVRGVEQRPELAALAERTARDCGCTGLEFRAGAIAGIPLEAADIVIALHACDTATDDALARAIGMDASIVVAAPCCQHELRPQMRPPANLVALARHGLFAGRLADMLTDALRGLWLESAGYRVKVIEFVSLEHTPKNTLLAAVRDPAMSGVARTRAAQEARDLMAEFGLRRQRLADMLAGSPGPAAVPHPAATAPAAS